MSDETKNENISNAYAELLNLTPAACLLLDGEEIVAVNDLAVATMEIPKEKLLGVALSELLLPDFNDAFEQFLKRLSPDEIDKDLVRLAHKLTPIELAGRSLPGELKLISVRSMANEHYYSSLAGGSLTHDSITGLPTHYEVLTQLQARLNAPQRKPIAVLCLWIDELAALNDSHGRRTVQRVFRDVGMRIEERLRGPDLVGRFGQEGFLITMTSDASTEQLTEIAERLRGEVSFPVRLDRQLVSFTASILVGSIKEQQTSVERILALLEAAAHRANTSGGNRTEVLAI